LISRIEVRIIHELLAEALAARKNSHASRTGDPA
jgi:hypothetical protein